MKICKLRKRTSNRNQTNWNVIWMAKSRNLQIINLNFTRKKMKIKSSWKSIRMKYLSCCIKTRRKMKKGKERMKSAICKSKSSKSISANPNREKVRVSWWSNSWKWMLFKIKLTMLSWRNNFKNRRSKMRNCNYRSMSKKQIKVSWNKKMKK